VDVFLLRQRLLDARSAVPLLALLVRGADEDRQLLVFDGVGRRRPVNPGVVAR
jgi:hypothetical protein